MGGKLEKLLPLYLVYVSRHGRFEQRQQNWRRGRLQIKGQRGKDASFTCAVLSRRATSPAPAQRKHCRYFSTLSRWGSSRCDHEKTNLVFRRSPDGGGILTSSKQQNNGTSMPAEYWYVPRVQKVHPARSLFIMTWGGVWYRFLVLLNTPP